MTRFPVVQTNETQNQCVKRGIYNFPPTDVVLIRSWGRQDGVDDDDGGGENLFAWYGACMRRPPRSGDVAVAEDSNDGMHAPWRRNEY